MKLAKSLLLGSTTAFVAVAGANAADLPSKKAAPATYVKVCDAYGAGFYTIPGTDTCIKVGGRVRADFAFSGRADVYANNVFANGDGSNKIGGYYYAQVGLGTATASSSNFGTAGTYVLGQTFNGSYTFSSSASSSTGYTYVASVNNGGTQVLATFATASSSTSASTAGTATIYGAMAGYTAANGIAKKAASLYGFEARGRVDVDARSATSYGTVQSVASIRLSRTTGTLNGQTGISSSSASPTLEAAYVRFAGFTFGAARDNFAYMPSLFYGTGHYAAFANGAKQLAYTAVLGGGISATLAIQDATDTTAGGVNAFGQIAAGTTPGTGTQGSYTTGLGYGYLVPLDNRADAGASNGTAGYAYNQMPQLNGRIDFEQSWGGVSVMGSLGQAVAVNTAGSFAKNKSTYAVAAGVTLNLPMIAAGDKLWLNGGYADGMTEYTTNWSYFKGSDTQRNVGGYVVTSPSWLVTQNGIETFKSWNVAGIFQHFWTPTIRHSFLASYGAVNGTTTSKQLAWSQAGAFGNIKVWNVGTQLAWLPVKDFEIGVDVLYARVAQDIRRFDASTVVSTATTVNLQPVGTIGATSSVTKEKRWQLDRPSARRAHLLI